MISFITSFKSFDLKYDKIQRSALYSWNYNNIPILAQYYIPSWWDDPRLIKIYEQVFDDFNITKILNVETGQDKGFKNNDCPLINDLLLKGIELSKTPMICLINSDVIIPIDFKEKFDRIFEKYGTDIFITATRRDIDLGDLIDSDNALDKISNISANAYNVVNSAEIFVTSKKIFKQMAKGMSPMIMGRYGWDNYIHFWMIANKIPCYNCTDMIPIYHCQHDHQHIENLEGKPGRNALSSIYNLTHLKDMQNKYGNTIRINKWPQISI